ncbi:MAG: DUF86 domain-containing protein [Bacteroidetes bacterium]|nr:DUF86 domain-containing protein [Bacteroidota bacterium]
MTERDKVRLLHILLAINTINSFVEGITIVQFQDDLLRQSGVTRQLEIIGEAVANISEELKMKYPKVNWREIKDFKNLLIHKYFRVDSMELWATIVDDLPDLKFHIETILDTNFEH